MKREVFRILIMGGLLCGSIAAADHNEPQSANLFKTSLVKSYEPCVAPDAVTTSGLPACEPATPSDPVCKFGPKGKGLAKGKVISGTVHDVQFKAQLKGLDTGCEGLILTGVVTVRATVDDCNGDACTVPDFVDYPLGSCTVTAGKCDIVGTVNTTTPGLLLTGRLTGLELLGCGVLNGSLRTFTCGVLVP